MRDKQAKIFEGIVSGAGPGVRQWVNFSKMCADTMQVSYDRDKPHVDIIGEDMDDRDALAEVCGDAFHGGNTAKIGFSNLFVPKGERGDPFKMRWVYQRRDGIQFHFLMNHAAAEEEAKKAGLPNQSFAEVRWIATKDRCDGDSDVELGEASSYKDRKRSAPSSPDEDSDKSAAKKKKEDSDKPNGKDSDKPNGKDSDKPNDKDSDKPNDKDSDKPNGEDPEKSVVGEKEEELLRHKTTSRLFLRKRPVEDLLPRYRRELEIMESSESSEHPTMSTIQLPELFVEEGDDFPKVPICMFTGASSGVTSTALETAWRLSVLTGERVMYVEMGRSRQGTEALCSNSLGIVRGDPINTWEAFVATTPGVKADQTPFGVTGGFVYMSENDAGRNTLPGALLKVTTRPKEEDSGETPATLFVMPNASGLDQVVMRNGYLKKDLDQTNLCARRFRDYLQRTAFAHGIKLVILDVSRSDNDPFDDSDLSLYIQMGLGVADDVFVLWTPGSPYLKFVEKDDVFVLRTPGSPCLKFVEKEIPDMMARCSKPPMIRGFVPVDPYTCDDDGDFSVMDMLKKMVARLPPQVKGRVSKDILNASPAAVITDTIPEALYLNSFVRNNGFPKYLTLVTAAGGSATLPDKFGEDWPTGYRQHNRAYIQAYDKLARWFCSKYFP